ncbi:MAG: hypothetical protein FGM24_02720 [Candidatus Kapabacteria bacterium]|nr:hypothetical protein [Candidatus Kapabacteria bacterium]
MAKIREMAAPYLCGQRLQEGMTMTTWKNVWTDRELLVRGAVSLLGLIAAVYAYGPFLARVELRRGVAFVDPVHILFAPIDLTWITFTMVYGAGLAAAALLLRRPASLMWAMQAYTLHVVFRMMMMWALPLDPPATMIPLTDPVASAFTGAGAPLTRDLFYSGHVGTLVVLSMVLPQQWARRVLAAMSVALGVVLIAQHVHYTVDVLVAPFVAAAAARLTRTSA